MNLFLGLHIQIAKYIQFLIYSYFQVFLEIVDVKDAEIRETENLYVSHTKKEPDMHFNGNRTLSILSLTGKKNVACFKCEPMGDLILTLIAKSDGTKSLVELTAPNSKLSADKWFQLNQNSCMSISVPIYLCVAISTTPLLPGSLVMNMVRSDKSFLPLLFLPFHGEKNNIANYWTGFVDVC